MSSHFKWNPYADQPHNVASRSKRLKHHLGHAHAYLEILSKNICLAFPVISLYRSYTKLMYHVPLKIGDSCGVSVSPLEGRNEEIVKFLSETGVKKTLVRIPSWERERIKSYENFLKLLFLRGFEVTVALLQNRDDVLEGIRWRSFLREAFLRFSPFSSFFEVGHAWNRTKWGVWNHREYLELVKPALELARFHGVKLVGPAVIDFEFHLYPPVLAEIPFDVVSSLLYVDRKGAPENKQFGFNLSKKVALLRAIVDCCAAEGLELWITEMNWPLKGTGKYSPAAGRPNVSEKEQADYLIRYFILSLASGMVKRVYWWQLVSPGYGLIDNRNQPWRKRPSFSALKNMISFLQGSEFKGKEFHPKAQVFNFRKSGQDFAICWLKGPSLEIEYSFSRKVSRLMNRSGEEILPVGKRIKLTQSPIYVFFT